MARMLKSRAVRPSSAAERIPELMDMDQALAALSTTRPTFYRWLRAGAIKGVKAGRQWRFRREDIERFLKGESPLVEVPADLKPLIRDLRQRLGERNVEQAGDQVQLAVMLAVRVALQLKASDLHLVAFADSGAMELRVDGALTEIARFSARTLSLLAEHFKRMCGMEAGGNRSAQSGTLKFKTQDRSYDICICTLPSFHGECVVARFMDLSLSLPDFAAMSFSPRDSSLIEGALKAANGVIVFAGGTGSGKSTAMHACAQHAATSSDRIITIGQDATGSMPHTVRMRLDPVRGMDMAASLRAALRCDPDIVALDYLKDRESMQAMAEISMTGHLVLCSYHATDAVDALRRMSIMCGNDPTALEEVRLVCAQRLVRRLCQRCSEALDGSGVRRAEALAKAAGMLKNPSKPTWRRSKGCPACRGSGFAGRIQIVEVLGVTPEIRAALVGGADDEALRALFSTQGFMPMVADGMRKAAEGLTAISEIQRLLPAHRAG